MYHSPIQLDVFPTDVQMRWIDSKRNMRRFYRLPRPDAGRTALRRGQVGQLSDEAVGDEAAAGLLVVFRWYLSDYSRAKTQTQRNIASIEEPPITPDCEMRNEHE